MRVDSSLSNQHVRDAQQHGGNGVESRVDGREIVDRHRLSAIMTIQMIGKYTSDAKNSRRAAALVRALAKRIDNTSNATPTTAATMPYSMPLSPTIVGTRLTGSRAAAYPTASRPTRRPSGSMTGSM